MARGQATVTSDSPRAASGSNPEPLLIIGCGNIVEFAHAPALADGRLFTVVGLVDPASRRRAAVARLLDRGGHEPLQYDSFADAPVAGKVVLVAVPSHLRPAVLGPLLRGARALVVEKPIAVDAAAAGLAVASAKSNGQHLIPVHNWLHDPAMRRLAELCASGAIGRVRRITYVHHMVTAFPGAWPGDPHWRERMAGGCVADLAYHAVYLIEKLTGKRVLDAECSERTGDDVLTEAVVLTWAEGVVGEIHVSWIARQPRFEVSVAGDAGHAVVRDDGSVTITIKADTNTERYPAGFPVAYRDLYRHIARDIGQEPTYDDADAAARISRLLQDVVTHR